MTTKTTPKKAWQKPEVFDLDVQNTLSGANTYAIENTTTAICAPSS